jgi:hypothetical protein
VRVTTWDEIINDPYTAKPAIQNRDEQVRENPDESGHEQTRLDSVRSRAEEMKRSKQIPKFKL